MANEQFIVLDGLAVNTTNVFNSDGILVGPSGVTVNSAFAHANAAYDYANTLVLGSGFNTIHTEGQTDLVSTDSTTITFVTGAGISIVNDKTNTAIGIATNLVGAANVILDYGTVTYDIGTVTFDYGYLT